MSQIAFATKLCTGQELGFLHASKTPGARGNNTLKLLLCLIACGTL